MKVCPFCAEEIQDRAVVCKHCGRDLAGGASQVELVERKGTKGIGFAGCILVLLLVVLGYCISIR